MAIVYGVSNDYLINSPGISTSTQKYSLWAKARKDGNRFLNPSLDLNFAENKSLIDDISGSNLVTFSRSSNATFVGADGLVGIASTNTPRFDHDPITRESKGLLIEEQRTNVLTYSDQFNNVIWIKNNAGITTNAAIAPDGTLTADTFVESTDGSSIGHWLAYALFPAQGIPYTFSVYVKYISRQWILLTGNRDGWHAFFDIQNGVLGNKGNFVSRSSIEKLPNEWYRCSVTIVTEGGVNIAWEIWSSIINGTFRSNSYIGSGLNCFYLWGAQLEVGSFPTSYIPTTTAAVTRTADQVSITGSNFTRWYPSSGGSIYVSGTPTDISQDRTNIVAIGNSTLTNYSALVSTLPGSRGAQFRSRNSGTVQADIVSVGSTLSKTSICASFSPGNFAVDSNSSGIAVTTSGIGTLGTSDRVQIGILSATSGQYTGTVERIAVFPVTIPSTAVSLVASTSPAPAGIGTNQFAFMVRMTSSGTYTLRTNNSGTYNYTVNWGDGTSTTHTTNNPTRTYSSAGVYRVTVTQNSGSFVFYNNADTTDGPRITAVVGAGSSFVWGSSFVSSWRECSSLTSFLLTNTLNGTNFSSAWKGCSSLTSFPAINTSNATTLGDIFDTGAWQNCINLTSFPLIDTSKVTNFAHAWNNCSELRNFPLINTSQATQMTGTWSNCNKLTTFPQINTSNCVIFSSHTGGGGSRGTWQDCSSLTSFPVIDVSKGVRFYATWAGCTSLTTFPALNFIAATGTPLGFFEGFSSTWQSCSSLSNFPANCFDNTQSTSFVNAFQNCALTAQSIENILVSINTANTSNGTLTLSGGSNANTSTWSATANSAYIALVSRGWTITQNGTAPT